MRGTGEPSASGLGPCAGKTCHLSRCVPAWPEAGRFGFARIRCSGVAVQFSPCALPDASWPLLWLGYAGPCLPEVPVPVPVRVLLSFQTSCSSLLLFIFL